MLILLIILSSFVICENVDKAWTKVKSRKDNVAGNHIFHLVLISTRIIMSAFSYISKLFILSS